MQCSEQRVIRIGTEFEVVGFDWEGNIRAREPMVTIEEATRWALANITSSGRVTFQACAAEALSEFVSGSVEDSTTPPDVPAWNAMLTSEWDGGISLTTKCVWDPINKVVLRQEAVELDGAGNCVREYVTYDDEEFEVKLEA